MKFVRSVVSFLRNGSFGRAQPYCGGRQLFDSSDRMMKGLLRAAFLLICLTLMTGCPSPPPPKAPDVNPGGPYTGEVGKAIDFDGSGSKGDLPLTYSWSFGDGTPTASGAKPSHTYSTAATFKVKLTVSYGNQPPGDSSKETDAFIAPSSNPPPPGGIATKTTFSKTDSKCWTSVGGANLSYASDSNTNTIRWRFNALGGFSNDLGWIESVEFPGKCLRSPNQYANSQIELAVCDSNDVRQQWSAMQQQMSGGKAFYSFVNNAAQKALTESSTNSQVTQTDYNFRDNQLWAVRRNDTYAFETDPIPWRP